MLEVKEGFTTFLAKYGEVEKRSMFGGTGFFAKGAMYALVKEGRIYLRGGPKLTDMLVERSCKKFVHVKKSSTAIVNYYDITSLYDNSAPELDDLVKKSIDISISEKEYRDSKANKRLRDLPNLRLTIERMLKKSGIEDVDTFFAHSPAEIFKLIQASHGHDSDIKLLWMFAGAQQGVHWTLLEESEKQRLMDVI